VLSEFERRAWDNRTSGGDHKPEMACKAVIDDIERGTIKAKQCVVVVVEDVDGADRIHVYNAGSLSELAVEGALNRAIILQANAP
jgi:predicted lipid-binding transport protein (Tim44 family)